MTDTVEYSSIGAAMMASYKEQVDALMREEADCPMCSQVRDRELPPNICRVHIYKRQKLAGF